MDQIAGRCAPPQEKFRAFYHLLNQQPATPRLGQQTISLTPHFLVAPESQDNSSQLALMHDLWREQLECRGLDRNRPRRCGRKIP